MLCLPFNVVAHDWTTQPLLIQLCSIDIYISLICDPESEIKKRNVHINLKNNYLLIVNWYLETCISTYERPNDCNLTP